MLGWVMNAAGSLLETLGHKFEPQDLVKILKVTCKTGEAVEVNEGLGSHKPLAAGAGHHSSGSQAMRKLLGPLGVPYLWVTGHTLVIR